MLVQAGVPDVADGNYQSGKGSRRKRTSSRCRAHRTQHSRCRARKHAHLVSHVAQEEVNSDMGTNPEHRCSRSVHTHGSNYARKKKRKTKVNFKSIKTPPGPIRVIGLQIGETLKGEGSLKIMWKNVCTGSESQPFETKGRYSNARVSCALSKQWEVF